MAQCRHFPYPQSTFHLSVNHLRQLPEDSRVEVAFAGRSNAGKSSAINTLTQQKSLCRVSKTPGRTQMINFFRIEDFYYLVDLPGYGYAKVPVKVKQHWQQLLEQYLTQRPMLQGVVLIMDIRHPLTAIDQNMLQWCQHANMPVHILLTKADKLKYGAAKNTLLRVQKHLQQSTTHSNNISLQLFSSLKKTGLSTLIAVLDSWYAG